MHSDGSGDTSHTNSNLIDPIHCQCYRGTGACAHDEVEGYIQPNIDPHQLRHHPIVRVYKVLYELFYGIIVMHTIINVSTKIYLSGA